MQTTKRQKSKNSAFCYVCDKGNNEVEVSGKKLDDGVARDDAKAKGTLSIIEAEFYEPLAEKNTSTVMAIR